MRFSAKYTADPAKKQTVFLNSPLFCADQFVGEHRFGITEVVELKNKVAICLTRLREFCKAFSRGIERVDFPFSGEVERETRRAMTGEEGSFAPLFQTVELVIAEPHAGCLRIGQVHQRQAAGGRDPFRVNGEKSENGKVVAVLHPETAPGKFPVFPVMRTSPPGAVTRRV